MGRTLRNTNPQTLVGSVGAKVRETREAVGMSRRVLSSLSGVSVRFLAQLEAGDGNISIARLEMIAQALEVPIERLLSSPVTHAAPSEEIVARFHAAPPEVQRQILDLLGVKAAAVQRHGRICLIGLRGAGKSTLGEAAATALDLPFLELNEVVEELAGMPVSEIMALYGPEGYRRLESDALTRIIETRRRVLVAAAGGVVSEPDTFARLLESFHTIWIKAEAQEHMDRVRGQGDMRPMGRDPKAMDQLRAILSARETLYAKAEGVVDTSGFSPERSLKALLELIETKGFLEGM